MTHAVDRMRLKRSQLQSARDIRSLFAELSDVQVLGGETVAL
jgi:hypothetical protein